MPGNKLAILLSLVFCSASIAQNASEKVVWQRESYTFAPKCDFPDFDFLVQDVVSLIPPYVRMDPRKMYFLCGKLCDETRGCTHFTFVDQECHLKRGEVSLNDAVNVSKDAKDDMMKCGFPNKVCPNIKCKQPDIHTCFVLRRSKNETANLSLTLSRNKLKSKLYKSQLTKCVMEKSSVKKPKSWRFVRAGFSEFFGQPVFKIQNCASSGEYLAWDNRLIFGDDNANPSRKRYVIASSESIEKEGDRMQSSDLWLLLPQNDGSTYEIRDAKSGMYFLYVSSDFEKGEQLPLIWTGHKDDESIGEDKLWTFDNN